MSDMPELMQLQIALSEIEPDPDDLSIIYRAARKYADTTRADTPTSNRVGYEARCADCNRFLQSEETCSCSPTSDERKAAQEYMRVHGLIGGNHGADGDDEIFDTVYKTIEAALQQPDTSYDPALYNADMDQLEFVTEDVTVVAQPINGWFNVLRKNGTNEIIGLQLNGPIAYAKHIAGQCEGKPDTSEAVGVLVGAIKDHSDSVHYCNRCGEGSPCNTDDVVLVLSHPAVIAAQKGDDRE